MIFLDASFLIAIFVENDQWHKFVPKVLSKIAKKKMFISKLVIAETITNLTNALDTKSIREIYANLNENFEVIDEHEYYDGAMRIFVKYDGKLSFFDCMYIYLMQKKGINEIASFDKHFDNKDGVIRIH